MRYQSIILLSRAARFICLRESDDEFFVSIKFLRDFPGGFKTRTRANYES